jgi:uncharacterized protein YecE (DUF72 family)
VDRAHREGTLRIGTSGWQYAHWRGLFYPRELRTSGWFARYAEVFDTVEVNRTFYRLPERETFEAWREQAPPGFLYALKFSRFGSHMKKLLDPEDTVGLYLERAAPLEELLGPILVQLPPRWAVNVDRLARFLDVATTLGEDVRWAVEVRDASWLVEPVFRALREHGAALCIHDLLPGHPALLTTDWTYLRFHGVRYGRSYAPAALDRAASLIRAWRDAGVDVYAYFNNDIGGHAVTNAQELRARLEPLAAHGASRP